MVTGACWTMGICDEDNQEEPIIFNSGEPIPKLWAPGTLLHSQDFGVFYSDDFTVQPKHLW